MPLDQLGDRCHGCEPAVGGAPVPAGEEGPRGPGVAVLQEGAKAIVGSSGSCVGKSWPSLGAGLSVALELERLAQRTLSRSTWPGPVDGPRFPFFGSRARSRALPGQGVQDVDRPAEIQPLPTPVDRGDSPLRGPRGGAGDRAGRGSRAWWGRLAPNAGCDAPRPAGARSPGSGSRGP